MAKRVLLVDDDASVESDVRALRMEGIDCDFCMAWEDTLQLFQVNHYDIVVSDYLLPNTPHGLKLLLEMRSIKPCTQVILISAYISPEREAEFRSLFGIVKYFQKPFDPSELAKTIRDALSSISESATDWTQIAQVTVDQGKISAEDVRRVNEEILAAINKGQ